MKILNCPLNGPRNVQEFVWGGEVTEMPDPVRCADADWADYGFLANNTPAVIREWSCHSATNYWFIAERDTATDEILKTYPASEIFTERKEFEAPEEDNKG